MFDKSPIKNHKIHSYNCSYDQLFHKKQQSKSPQFHRNSPKRLVPNNTMSRVNNLLKNMQEKHEEMKKHLEKLKEEK